MTITTTLADIKRHRPCKDGWTKLLEHLAKTEADDEPLPLAVILKSNGLSAALWALRATPEGKGIAVEFANACAKRAKGYADAAARYADAAAAAAAADADAAAYADADAAAAAGYAAAADAAYADAAARHAAAAARHAAYAAAAADAAARYAAARYAAAADHAERRKQRAHLRRLIK